MFKSSYLNIETPKKFLRSKAHINLESSGKRFKPTDLVRGILVQVDRIHKFSFHEQINLFKLEDVGLSHEGSSLICEWANTHKKPDIVKSFEKLAMSKHFYDSEVHQYLMEEFDCREEDAFTIITVFTYMKLYSLGIDGALHEIFVLSNLDSVCQECSESCLFESDEKKLVDEYNYKMLNGVLGVVEDDSFEDPDCKLQATDYVSESDSSDECSIAGEIKKKINIMQHRDTHISDVFNPFLDASGSDSLDEEFDPMLSSYITESIASVRSVSNRKKILCVYCRREFSNRFNMKMHVIRYDAYVMSLFVQLGREGCVRIYGY